MKHVLRPLFDRVVIKELEPERFRRSGLLVPPGTNEPPPQHGIVLAVGQGLDWWDHVGVRMPIAPGDHVVFPASAGGWVEGGEGGPPGGRGARSTRSACWCAASGRSSACSKRRAGPTTSARAARSPMTSRARRRP